MAREFEELRLREMESLLEREGWDAELAGRLLFELNSRRANADGARKFRARPLEIVSDEQRRRIQDLAPAPTATHPAEVEPPSPLNPYADEVATIRPPGTPGLPSREVAKSRNTDFKLPLEPGASRVAQYRAALDEYIQEQQQNKRGKRFDLRDGVRLASPSEGVVYRFEIEEADGIRDGTECELVLGEGTEKGIIKEKELGAILITLNGNLGERIPKAQLLLDETKLLQKLRERIGAVDSAGVLFNHALANAAVGAGTAPAVQVIPDNGMGSALRGSQVEARRRALEQSLTFIWGPPGCGKSFTLCQIVRTAFDAGRRVLICSNTNKAVDQVVGGICAQLGKTHPAMQAGQVVRLGDLADPQLERNFGEYISVPLIVDRIRGERAGELQALRFAVSEAERALAATKDELREFDALDAARERLHLLTGAHQELVTRTAALDQECLKADAAVSQLETAVEKARNGRFRFLGKSAEQLAADLESFRARQRSFHSAFDECAQQRNDAEQASIEVRRERDTRALALAGKSREVLKATLEAQQAEFQKAKEARDALEEYLAGLKTSLVREAKVLGATGTLAYLIPDSMGPLDVVIVDEGSMLLQPMVWLIAGLARERVILCGDFRQIPPICNTDRQVLFDLIGRDVFEAAGVTKLDPRDTRMVMLDTQWRMDAAICDLISGRMYAGRLKTTNDTGWLADRATWRRPPAPFDGALTIIDTSALRPQEGFRAGSRLNLMHAVLIRSLAWHFTQAGFAAAGDQTALAVCTPYKEQARRIRELLKAEGLRHVQVGTVHTFQGDERKAIVVEFPESGDFKLGRFLTGATPEEAASRLINVAVSRARNHLIVLVNLRHLDAKLPSDAMLRGVLYDMQARGRVLPATALLAVGPRDRDLQGLEDVVLSEAEQRLGVFNSASFDRAFARDVGGARESIAIFSGFVSVRRVLELQGLLGKAKASGVRIRCVSKPPKKNSHDPASGTEAFDLLERAGCVVDGRDRAHEKVLIIDGRIVWHGSLNVLSFAQVTDEIMSRIVSPQFAQSMALTLAKKRVRADKVLALLPEPENPRCDSCGGRTSFNDTRKESYFECEADCRWREQIAQSVRKEPSGQVRGGAPPCPKCGSPTVLRMNRSSGNFFYGCTRFVSTGCKGSVNVPVEDNQAESE